MGLFREDPPKEQEIGNKTLFRSIKKYTNPPKKKVKYTWKGLANLLSGLSPTNIPQTVKRLEQLKEGSPETEKDYIDFFEDLEKGVYGIAENTAYSIGDLATMGMDAVAGTNLNEKIDDLYRENKLKDPELFISKATELVGTYGLPSGLVFKLLSRLGKVNKMRRGKQWMDKTLGTGASTIASRAGYMAGAFGAVDFLGAQPDTPTFFTELENTENLTGRKRAAAKFRNRLRYGAEGATIGGGFALFGKPIALGFKYGLFKPGAKVAGLGLRGVDKAVVQPAAWLLSKDKWMIPKLSKALHNSTSYGLQKIISPLLIGRLPTKKLIKELPDFDQWRMFSVNSADPLKKSLKKLDNVFSWFRSLGQQTGQQYKITTRARQEIKARSRTIEKYLEDIEKRAYDLGGGFKRLYNTKTTSPASKDQYLDQVLTYLRGNLPMEKLPKDLQNPARGLHKELVQLKQKFGDLLPEGDLKDFMLNNVQNYMRKSFSIFTNPTYQPKQKVIDGAVDWFEKLITKNRDMREAALRGFKNIKDPAQAIKEYAKILTRKVLHDGKTNGGDPLEMLQRIAKHDLRLKKQVMSGEELPDAIKRLLGEENNLKASVLTTSSHAITQTVNKRMADRLAAIGVKEGWLFKSREAAKSVGKILDPHRIIPPRSLGLLQTRLGGTGKRQLYGSGQISQAIQGTPGALDNLIQSNAYRAILQLKVATQFGKTVLSPATQVRNVTSASLFPLASGHIGGRASVTEAFRMTLDDIFGAGKKINDEALIKSIENKIRYGVIDENIVASELGAVLKDIKKGSITTLDGLYNQLTNGKFMKGAVRLYAGGDNVWKWYGHEYVKSQLRGTYKNINGLARWTKEITGQNYVKRDLITNKLKTYDQAIDEAAAWYIRNTYPTYSKVPEAIKAIRKLPFGNFVSFPAEMMRTSFNLVNIAAKEIASSNPLLRQIGYRRMMGTTFTLGGAGEGALQIASFVTGTPLEHLDAYKRSFAAPWNADSILLPMNKWADGVGKAINFSYFSPYEVVQKPVSSFLRELERREMTGQEIDDDTLKYFTEFMGPLVDPFISEAIALERIQDVLPAGKGGRGGQTKTGSKVYSETDDTGTRIQKSFAHIIQGVEPGAITTLGKIKKGIQKDVTKGGTPVNARDEILALFSGIRIINVDVPRSYNYKLTDFNKRKRSVTVSEDFYNLTNLSQRGGEALADEFRQIQDESFKIQQDFYQTIQDAREMGVSLYKLKEANKKRLSSKEFFRLLSGRFTPVQYSKDRMYKRVKDARKAHPDKTIDSSWVFPMYKLKRVINEYRGKSLKPEEPLKPIEEIDREESRIVVPKKQFASRLKQPKMQTPPLPPTPAATAVNPRNTAVINPLSGLTRSETALLSPSEQEIARRT
jgi:hypothetical protein